jgi:hypothetical protein
MDEVCRNVGVKYGYLGWAFLRKQLRLPKLQDRPLGKNLTKWKGRVTKTIWFLFLLPAVLLLPKYTIATLAECSQAQYRCLCLPFLTANEAHIQMQIQNPKAFESFNSARLL